MKVVESCLVDDGLFLLHTIGTNTTRTAVDPWTNKYIFPGRRIAGLPSRSKQPRAVSSSTEDWQNFGTHYDPTLMAWMANVDEHAGRITAAGV